MELEGKISVVTGGGRGIGRGIVELFLEEGAQVAVVDREPLDEALASHPSIAYIPADLSLPSALPTVVDSVVSRFGGIDVLVNNAGISGERHISEIELEDWDLMIAINLRAPLFLAQAVLPHMRRRGGGSIINIGSVEGIAANPEHGVYCASKAGVHGMTRALAVDVGADNVRCNAIAPGWINSKLSDEFLDAQPDPAVARAGLNHLHPIGRVGQPADIAQLAVFLASDRSAFLTGEVIVMDGGRTAKLPMPF